MDPTDSDSTWPSPGLLETDIAKDSYNQAPWTSNKKQEGGFLKQSDRVELSSAAADPFFDLRLSDPSALDSVSSRSPCPKCHMSRKYFCYSCHIPLSETRNLIPRVEKLPVKIDVIKHANEVDGKV